MSTNTSTHAALDPAVADADACACHLYDAECALHAAHQSGVETWIAAAADRLHEAVIAYLTAIAGSAAAANTTGQS